MTRIADEGSDGGQQQDLGRALAAGAAFEAAMNRLVESVRMPPDELSRVQEGILALAEGHPTDPCPAARCLFAGQPHEHVAPPRPLSRFDREEFADLQQQIRAIEDGHEAQEDGTWTCPGCGLDYDEIPVGHTWSYGRGGSCSTPAPMQPWAFLPRASTEAMTADPSEARS